MKQSIKISDAIKEKIMQLQARILLEYDVKINQNDLIDYMVEKSLKDPEIIEKIIHERTYEKSMDEWLQRLNEPKDWEVSDSSEDIDSHVYENEE